MKKILFFINTLNGGGAEKVLVDLVNNLDPQKFQITVQTFWDAGVYRSALKEHIAYKTVIRIKNPAIRRLVTKFWTEIVPTKYLYKWYVKEEYDCEIAFLEGFPTRVIAASTQAKARKIAWLHTDILQYPNSELAYGKAFSEKKAYEKMDRIICVSESVRESLLKKYNISEEKTAVLYNVVDDETICSKGKQLCAEEIPHPLVMSVGRLNEQKAFDRLLRVHKRLIEEKVNHTLWILGEGEKRQELEAYIRDNNLRNVKLLGFRENPYAYMAKADLFVSSSIAEGFSTVITESVILGVPVISTNTAGAYEPPEAPRCSVVVNNEDQLYETVKEVLQDASKLQQMKDGLADKQKYLRKEVFVQKIEQVLLEQ